MTDTPNLALPQIAAAQAQKHITHNEALAMLDALVQLSVLSRNVTAPPALPQDGQRYIIPASATGGFVGHQGKIALFDSGMWRYLAPKAGWLAYVQGENSSFIFNGTAWVSLGQAIGSIDQMASLGIGTTSDALNKLAVRSSGALITAPRISGGGTGDARLIIEKESAARTGSVVFQDNYSARAEFGLMGDDDLRLKVSGDGVVWRDALVANRATGQVSFPNGALGVGGSDSAFGQCRLVKNAANITLVPFNGNQITVAGVAQILPGSGVSLAPAGLSAATTYLIYAYMVSGIMALEASVTTHATDAATGVEIKSGDNSRTLVGMARTISGPAWQDIPAQLFVISWFNRRPRALRKEVATSYSTNITTYAEIGAGAQRLEFLTWANSACEIKASMTFDGPDNGTGATAGYFRMTLDGVAASGGEGIIYANLINAYYVPVMLSHVGEMAEGYRYGALDWRVLGAGPVMTNVGVGMLNGMIFG